VVHALGESKAVIVGHDWGAPVAWTSAWLHPEVFRGVVGLSVPFSGRGLVALPGSPFGERRPDELHAELAGPGQDFYQDYLGTLGPVIEEFESDLRGWIRDGVFSLSRDAHPGRVRRRPQLGSGSARPGAGAHAQLCRYPRACGLWSLDATGTRGRNQRCADRLPASAAPLSTEPLARQVRRARAALAGH
jgi:pimeloyl-ACP methyl ester carboxylesterase